MVEWWNTLTSLERFFATVAIPSTLILFLQTIMLVMSFGGDLADMDGDVDTSDGFDDDMDDTIADGGLRLFTVRGFVAFFSVFGWSGIVFLKSEIPPTLSVLFAVILGFLSMAFIAFSLAMFLKLQSNGTVDVENAIGVKGVVYLPIPSERGGVGKITALVSGRLTEFEAVTDEKETIKTQASVTVVAITGGNTLVVISK